MFWFSPLGTIRFYRAAINRIDNKYRENATKNVLRICARNKIQAQREVKLTDITTEDVICWYSRDAKRGTLWLDDPNIWHEERAGFDCTKPEAYQISRIQVDGARLYDKTRQAMCMFCQVPAFYCLSGRHGLLFHIQYAHPHETPEFVKILMTELNLLPRRRKHPSCYTSWADILAHIRYQWYGFHYLDDGVSNQLRIAPRPGLANTTMKLADVSEDVLVPWFERTLEDFQNYTHPHITYRINPDFDPHNPSVYQLARYVKDKNGKGVERTTQFACMYCQEPHFLYIHGFEGYLSHLSSIHWPVVIPSVKEILAVKLDLVYLEGGCF